VDIFFDTTVLVAASEQSHPHYAQARPALLHAASRQDKGFMGLHSIAEVFAALTRLLVQPRIHPVEAGRIVTDNILPYFEFVSLGKEDYLEALNTTASGGWIGTKIYDALLLRCAARCGIERIYTFNLEDFKQLAPAGLREKICAPGRATEILPASPRAEPVNENLLLVFPCLGRGPAPAPWN
jgi:predicted nucleic acid-binding protein